MVNNYQFDIMERCDFMPLTAELASLPFCCGETEGDYWGDLGLIRNIKDEIS